MKGCLKAYLIDGDTGKEFIYYFAAEDWWITDREAFFNQEAADCYAVNLSNPTVFRKI